jgi:hypothetical protein
MNGGQKNARQKNILATFWLSVIGYWLLVTGYWLAVEIEERDESDPRDVKDDYGEDKARISIGKKMGAGKCTT